MFMQVVAVCKDVSEQMFLQGPDLSSVLRIPLLSTFPNSFHSAKCPIAFKHIPIVSREEGRACQTKLNKMQLENNSRPRNFLEFG